MNEFAPHVTSFYHLAHADGCPASCRGTACFAARHRDPARWRQSTAGPPAVYCLGECHVAPAATGDAPRPHMQCDAPHPVLLANLLHGGAVALDDYRARGGYRALALALSLGPSTILDRVDDSGLRGRGGAGFSTGRKWRGVAAQADPIRVVVANADEGDPGAYIDRYLVEDDPHRLIEGMAIASLAVGADRGVIYLRREYPRAAEVMTGALAEARREGYLGASVAGSEHAFDIELVIGHGSYVCGEETALINAVEGRRPEAMARPPYPFQRGLGGHPTLVNNVETLCAIPWIVNHGGAAYAALGFSKSRGTKVVSLNSLFRRPGLYEVEFGVPLSRIVDDLGGGLITGKVRALMIGGPLAGILPPAFFGTPFAFEELHDVGAAVGHGGIVAFDETTEIREIVDHVFRFAARESCGKCVPCREGTAALTQRLESGALTVGEWHDLVRLLADASLCGLGTGAADFARSVDRHFTAEFQPCLA